MVSEILKNYLNRGLEAPLYFWRDRTGNEIDLLIDDGAVLHPVEFKSGKTVVADYFKTLRKWKQWAGKRSGKNFVVYGGKDEQSRTDVYVLPWHKVHEVVKH